MRALNEKLKLDMHPVVFPISAGLILLFVLFAALAPERALITFNWLQEGIANNFSWLYIISMTFFLVFALWLCFSHYGDIRLGREGEEPEFPTVTWFAMLFSAGMGIGMLFFGVAEPMFHYLSPPVGRGGNLDAAREAMGITLFHWCLHPWALYALVALSLAYFGFRRGLPLSFRSVFYPLVGDRVHGRFGDVIDILAVCATLFGLATSLGLGAKQVNAGLNYVFGLPQSATVQVILIACITTAAVASLVSGLDVGIRRLSELNMGLAGFLLLFLFVAGPTVFLLSSVVENIGTYVRMLPTNSFWTATYEGESRVGWFSSWTVFYWGWWIAWSPFVGMFIARVSKGRTIREFILGVLLVPTLVAIVWMTGFGNTALHQEVYSEVSANPELVEKKYGYAPEEYDVQVLDPDHGLPLTADRRHMVANGVLAVDDGEGNLVAVDGTPIAMSGGILVNTETGKPYRPGPEARFNGKFAARKAELTLAGFLSQPVLNREHTARMQTTATCMFVMLNAYPFASLTAIIGTLSVILFFVTSSDSASMVADIIASGGNQDPPVGTRLFWGILEGILAAVLLVFGGLEALQTGAITVGLPFCIVILFMCYSLYRGLAREKRGELPEEHLAHVMSIRAEQEDEEPATTTE